MNLNQLNKKDRYKNFLNIIKDVVNFKHMSDNIAPSTHIMGSSEIIEKFIPKCCKELSLKYDVLKDQYDTSKIHSIYELENDNSLDILFIKILYPSGPDMSKDMIELMDYTVKNEIPVVVVLFPIYMESTLIVHA